MKALRVYTYDCNCGCSVAGVRNVVSLTTHPFRAKWTKLINYIGLYCTRTTYVQCMYVRIYMYMYIPPPYTPTHTYTYVRTYIVCMQWSPSPVVATHTIRIRNINFQTSSKNFNRSQKCTFRSENQNQLVFCFFCSYIRQFYMYTFPTYPSLHPSLPPSIPPSLHPYLPPSIPTSLSPTHAHTMRPISHQKTLKPCPSTKLKDTKEIAGRKEYTHTHTHACMYAHIHTHTRIRTCMCN